MKNILTFYVLLLTLNLMSQPQVVPYRIKNQWTFYNTISHKKFIDRWDTVRQYSCNVAMVKYNNKWGVIDTSGKYIYPLLLDTVVDFYDNKAYVKQNNKWFWIDNVGKIFEKPPTTFYGCGGAKGFSTLCFGQYRIGNKVGLVLNNYDEKNGINIFDTLPAIYDKLLDSYGVFVKTQINNKQGVASVETGKDVLKCIYDNIEFNYEESQESLKALHKVTKNGKIGFLNNKMKLVIKCKYNTASTFINGLSFVTLPNGLSYYINYKGFAYYSNKN